MNDNPKPPVFFLLAHHDDELFIAATIKHLAGREGQVLVAWFTCGGIGANQRLAESVKAMELLGVSRQCLYFFRLPDNCLLDYLEDIVKRLVFLWERRRPGSVFVPAFEGGHQDHDTVQLAAAAASRRLAGTKPDLYEFPLYHRYRARLLSVGEFIPDEATVVLQTPLKLRDRLLKQKLAGIYKSQRLIVYPLLALKGWPMMLHRQGEPYRRVPAGRDYTRPPYPGRPVYEYYSRLRFKKFARLAGDIMKV